MPKAGVSFGRVVGPHRNNSRAHGIGRRVLLITALALAGQCGDHLDPSGSPAPQIEAPPLKPAALPSAPESADWEAQVSERIRANEYEIGADSGGWSWSNRAQSLRGTFGRSVVRIGPRTGKGTVVWKLTAMGRRQTTALPDADFGQGPCRSDGAIGVTGQCLKRLRAQRGILNEWWENRPEGLEQGMTIHERAPGRGALRLSIEIQAVSWTVDSSGSNATIVAPWGAPIHVGNLSTMDANGQPVPTRMNKTDRGIEIVVEDAAAPYPLEVDPLLTNVAWAVESNVAGANLGISASTAGDVNGDGYDDVIVGAHLYSTVAGQVGAAFIYAGSSSGLSMSPLWTDDSGQANSSYGWPARGVGDLNGDGYSDVAVGASNYSNGSAGEGAVFIYYGAPSGPSTTPNLVLEGNSANNGFGADVGGAGDVNGDGYADLLVGAPGHSNGESGEGQALLYPGGAAGLGSTPVWTYESNEMDAGAGSHVSGAGDVNGDGFADILVTVFALDATGPDFGAVLVYHGAASWPAATPARTLPGASSFVSMGHCIGSAGDVDGDGYADILVGAGFGTNGQSQEGIVYLHRGSPAGVGAVPVWQAEANQAFAQMGRACNTAGDVNGDGYADVVVGASMFDAGQSDEGRAFLYLGSATGLSPAPSWTAESNQVNGSMGSAAGTAGDVNGDGYADIIVGAYGYGNGQAGEGSARVFYGSPSLVASTPVWNAESNQASSTYGLSVTHAGDVNGDGYADVAVGAWSYDNGEIDEGRAFLYLGSPTGPSVNASWTAEPNHAGAAFGQSVAGAGDVNGDGYADLIVGAPGYSNPEMGEGRAYLYAGSPTGLSATPAWTSESDVALATFGFSVAGAGDTNGDGYGDVIVGMTGYTNPSLNEGGARVFLGSAAGLQATHSWQVEANQVAANMGVAVASAGDVNGDGYGDVMVGADFYDNGQSNEGRAFVYHGGPSGPSTTAAWTTESNQNDSQTGFSLGSAGDVNGDGFGDVIVGMPYYSNGQSSEGRASVFHGSASGLSVNAAWTGESDQASSWFGLAVASAGDVNGDGYSDIVVGAPGYDNGMMDQGRASVCFGSSTGIAMACWTFHAPQASANVGISVSSAGDVNGDGFADVLLGATGYDNGESEEGRAYVFYGNGADGTGPGLSLVPQVRVPGLGQPIAPGGVLAAGPSYEVKVFARTPYGRQRVKLEVESKLISANFDSTGLVRSSSWMDIGVAGQNLALIVNAGLNRGFHWRARLLYDPLGGYSARHSRWLWGGVSGQPSKVHVRTGASCVDFDMDLICDTNDSDDDNDGDPDSSDCDDHNPSVRVGAPEVCNGIDDNCVGGIDEGLLTLFYRDADSDTYGDAATTQLACSAPGAYVTRAGDCDDTRAGVNPSATEVPDNGLDDDCVGGDQVTIVDAGPPDAGAADGGSSDAGVSDSGTPDAGQLDAGSTDAGATDSGPGDAGPPTDAGLNDAGAGDAGHVDAGIVDGGGFDGGGADGGVFDSGTLDGGSSLTDSGVVDAGSPPDSGPQMSADAGTEDAGTSSQDPRLYTVGCDCNSASGASGTHWLLLVLSGLWSTRSKRRVSP